MKRSVSGSVAVAQFAATTLVVDSYNGFADRAGGRAQITVAAAQTDDWIGSGSRFCAVALNRPA
jgi:hypothetical protein